MTSYFFLDRLPTLVLVFWAEEGEKCDQDEHGRVSRGRKRGRERSRAGQKSNLVYTVYGSLMRIGDMTFV